ncbi:hypothetical protein [Streptomyces sp. KL116D]|uniref:hypothetical protein n=1 Tax=Streptomyces sp. KL116D TaxID=3045152 RepID=UPI0035588226
MPVHNALAEFDALLSSGPQNVATLRGTCSRQPLFIDATVARGTGHRIDHHTLGHALHLRQFAFAAECAQWAAARRQAGVVH